MVTPEDQRVSVMIPNYNHGRFLRQCLESVLGQSRRPNEVLVGDGGSTDGSLTILDEYEASYPALVRVFKLNLAVNPTIEFLVKEAKGDYIAFLGSDDWWDYRFLDEMLSAIGEGCLAYCDVFAAWPGQLKLWRVPDHDLNLLKRTNYISFNATLIRKELLELVIAKSGRLLDDRVGVPSDWDLWLRMAPICKFVHVAKPLAYYRKHRQQNSARLRLQYDVFQIFRRYNHVTISSIFKIFFVASAIATLRMYKLHLIADFFLIPYYRKPVDARNY